MKNENGKNKTAGGDGVEIDAGSEVLPQHPLPLLVQAGLLVPQKLQQFSAWRTAFPQDWFVHHHQVWAAPGAGGVLLSLLLVGEGPLVPPVAVLLDLAPV